MNEIETTLESGTAPRPIHQRVARRRPCERSENGGQMPMLLTVDDATRDLRVARTQAIARRDSHPPPCLDPLGRTVRVARPEARAIAEGVQ